MVHNYLRCKNRKTTKTNKEETTKIRKASQEQSLAMMVNRKSRKCHWIDQHSCNVVKREPNLCCQVSTLTLSSFTTFAFIRRYTAICALPCSVGIKEYLLHPMDRCPISVSCQTAFLLLMRVRRTTAPDARIPPYSIVIIRVTR